MQGDASGSQVDDAAIERARSNVGRTARDLLSKIEGIRLRAETLLAQPEALRASARDQTAALTRRQLQAELENLPTTALQEVMGKSGKHTALQGAGYLTVAQLVAASADELTAIPGIGPKTAERITTAVRTIADRTGQATRFSFRPDSPDAQQRDLLATVIAIRHADNAASEVAPLLDEFAAATSDLLSAAAPTGRRLSMLVSGRARKRAALAALVQLEAVSNHPRTAWLEQELARHERAVGLVGYTDERLWGEYSADAATVNATLSTVGGAGATVDAEAAQGFIPEELRQRITAVPLDVRLVKSTLRGYQVFGAQYAIHQERAMLGDEMGLGKTIQALAAAAHLAANGQQRFLVVCPASVQMNWLNEIAKHTRLSPHNLHGATRDAAARKWLREGGVAVTTFGTLARLEEVKQHDTAMLIVDEAHYVKNPKAVRSQTVDDAAARAQRVLFLTGTPMENRVEEFRNLVGYLQPQLARRVDATDVVAGANRFRRAVAPVYLRRNQEDVLTELPDKIEVDDWVLLTPQDEAAYREAVRSRNLMAMRQAAFQTASPAKLDRIREIVDEAREDGRKVIVFSFFLGVLGRIAAAIGPDAAGPICGSVPPRERQRLVDEFSAARGHAVLLSQIDAGGVGLNVQAASVVVLAEPQWKPSTEEQAIARAHRMGQIRTVQVHRLLAKDSVDERMREVQERKRLLFDEYARKSDAKEMDSRAVDTNDHRPDDLDNEAIPVEWRIVLAEQHRLGLD
ncbi:helix-hairpin-helix protein [Kribbella steppae]|uniref:Helix-hairpin-helix protein n=2 Tax=Kribbella steppae TaxID=2512223 RepID=A0A4R2HLJ0_9ACTN|nr:helix-hairpin-helix protein [Kribbella steppae]